MKNIHALLEKFGLSIPEDKKKDFEKELEKNYKTVSEIEVVRKNLETANQNLKTRDEDLEKLRKQLESAGEDSEKVKSLTKEIEDLRKSYDDEKKESEKKLKEQQYEFLVREKVSGLSFSSNAAKKAFTSDLIEKGLSVEDGKLLGFDDFVKTYKENDAGVFSEETGNKSKFGGKSGGLRNPMTKEDILKIKNSAERQKAIAEHLDLFE